MDPAVSSNVLTLKGGEHREEEVELVVEEPLEIRIDGTPYAVIMRTPGHEMELATGFCLTEGIVDSFSEIGSIGFCEDAADENRNIVNVVIGAGGAGEGVADLRQSAARGMDFRNLEPENAEDW